jgi:hypothetical protein
MPTLIFQAEDLHYEEWIRLQEGIRPKGLIPSFFFFLPCEGGRGFEFFVDQGAFRVIYCIDGWGVRPQGRRKLVDY